MTETMVRPLHTIYEGFYHGTPVICEGRSARVIASYPKTGVPDGVVPIVYDGEFEVHAVLPSKLQLPEGTCKESFKYMKFAAQIPRLSVSA